jgi:hypothetical protein
MIKISLVDGAKGARGNSLDPFLYFKYENGIIYYSWCDSEELFEDFMLPRAEDKKSLSERIVYWVRTGNVKEIRALED